MRPHLFTCNAKVRDGFPVRLRGHIWPAEPDVGLPTPYTDDLEVLTMRGTAADWLCLTDDEVQECVTQFFEALHQEEHERMHG